MAFNNSNFGNNNSNPGEKKSWRIGKDFVSSDAKFSIGMYESAYKNAFCTIQIMASIGKDPTTGTVAFEQRPPQEIPSIMLSHEMLEALIDHFTDKNRTCNDRQFFPNFVDPTNLNETIDCGRGSKITFVGSPTSVQIKISREGSGERTGTLNAIQLSNSVNFASWRIILQKMFYVLSYMNTVGIDAEKFSAAMGGTTGITMTKSEDIVPDDLPI